MFNLTPGRAGRASAAPAPAARRRRDDARRDPARRARPARRGRLRQPQRARHRPRGGRQPRADRLPLPAASSSSSWRCSTTRTSSCSNARRACTRRTGAPARSGSQACDFYEEDLASGFVRLLMELMARELPRRGAAPRVRAPAARLAPAGRGGRRRFHQPVRAGPAGLGEGRSRPGSCWFWIGMEASMMLGHRRERTATSARRSRRWRSLLRRVEGPRQAQGRFCGGRDAAAGPAADCRERLAPDGRRPCRRQARLPEPYPFETHRARCARDSSSSEGVRSWYAQFGDSGPWLAFAPAFQIGNAHLLQGRRALPGAALPRGRRWTCAAMAGRTGRSRRAAYSFEHYFADFVAVLDRLEVDRVALVGISAGDDARAAPRGGAAASASRISSSPAASQTRSWMIRR